MAYMQVKRQTESQLCLLREPTFLSKAVFVGFFVGILGIFFFGSESFIFKAVIGLCAIGLSCLIVDNYEICEFDKNTFEVKLTRLHWCQFILKKLISLGSTPYLKVRLSDIKDVKVEEQGGPNGSKAYQVILSLESGLHVGVTEVFTTDDISEHEKVAKIISNFLSDLPSGVTIEDADDEGDEELSSSDEDFEQISKDDLVELDEANTDKGSRGDEALSEVCKEEEDEKNVVAGDFPAEGQSSS